MDVLSLERMEAAENLNKKSMPVTHLSTIHIHILSRTLLDSTRYPVKLSKSGKDAENPLSGLWIKESDSQRLSSCLQEAGRITTVLSAAEDPALRLVVTVSIDISYSGLENASCLLMDKVIYSKPLGIVSAFYLDSFRKRMNLEIGIWRE